MGRHWMFCVFGCALGFSTVSVAIADGRHTAFLKMREDVGEGRYREAIAGCKLLMQTYPDYVALYESLAEISQYAGDLFGAARFFEERIEEGTELGLSYFGLGTVHRLRGDHRPAITFLGKAIDLGVTAPECYRDYEYTFEALEGADAAVRYFLSLCQRHPDNANYWYAASLAQWSKANYREAVQLVREALLRRPDELKFLQAEAALELTYASEDSIDDLRIRHIVSKSDSLGDVDGAILVQTCLGLHYGSNNFIDKARKVQENTCLAAKAYGFHRWSGWAMLQQADLDYWAGSFFECTRKARDASESALMCNDTDLLRASLAQQFGGQLQVGYIEEALRILVQRQSCPTFETNAQDRFLFWLDFSRLAVAVGAFEIGLDFGIEALNEIRYEQQGPVAESAVHDRIAHCYLGLGNFQQAERRFLLAQSLLPKEPQYLRPRTVLAGSIGSARLALGDTASARRYFQEQLNMALSCGYRSEAVSAFVNLGMLFEKSNQLVSKAFFSKALAIGEKVSTVFPLMKALRGLRDIAMDRNDFEGAYGYSIRLLDLESRISRAGWLALPGARLPAVVSTDAVDHAILMAKCQGLRSALSFALSGYGDPVNPLLESLGVSNWRSEWFVGRQRIVQRIDQEWTSLSHGQAGFFLGTDIRARVNAIKRIAEYECAIRPRRARQSRDGTTVVGLSRMLPDSSKLWTPALTKEEALLSVSVGRQSTVSILLVQDTIFASFMNCGRDSVACMLKRFSPLVASEPLLYTQSNEALADFSVRGGEAMYALLLKPLEHTVKGKRRIYFHRNFVLANLPLDACVTSSDSNGVDHDFQKANFVAHSFEVQNIEELGDFSRERRNWSVFSRMGLVLAPGNLAESTTIDPAETNRRRAHSGFDGGLPGVFREAHLVEKALGGNTDVMTGKIATREMLMSLGKTARVVHFAGHSAPNHVFPLNSTLTMFSSQDGVESEAGLTTAVELGGMRCSPHVFMLNACNSARAIGTPPMRPFVSVLLTSGTREVVGHLWSGDDDILPGLLDAFYKYWTESGNVPASLREAKLQLIREGKRDPFYWASITSFQHINSLERTVESNVVLPQGDHVQIKAWLIALSLFAFLVWILSQMLALTTNKNSLQSD